MALRAQYDNFDKSNKSSAVPKDFLFKIIEGPEAFSGRDAQPIRLTRGGRMASQLSSAALDSRLSLSRSTIALLR